MLKHNHGYKVWGVNNFLQFKGIYLQFGELCEDTTFWLQVSTEDDEIWASASVCAKLLLVVLGNLSFFSKLSMENSPVAHLVIVDSET